jgi:hypothetical protein
MNKLGSRCRDDTDKFKSVMPAIFDFECLSRGSLSGLQTINLEGRCIGVKTDSSGFARSGGY